MQAVAHRVEQEWNRDRPIRARYAFLRMMATPGVPDARPSGFVVEAAKGIESLRDFILELHSKFLAGKPARLLRGEWTELANTQIGKAAADCAVMLDEVLNTGSRADPEFQRRWIDTWEKRWVSIANELVDQIATQATLNTPQGSDSNKLLSAGKYLGKRFLDGGVRHVVAVGLAALGTFVVAYWNQADFAELLGWLRSLFHI